MKLSKMACAFAFALSFGLAACGGDGGEEDASAPPPGSTPGEGMGAATLADFRTGMNMQELMAHVIDYNAFEVWHRQGWIIGDSVVELFPVDDDGWLAAENAARTVAEASNLLLLPGRPRDEDRHWVDYANQLYDASMKAAEMAEKQDKDAFFNAGTDMYRACRGCHERYIAGANGPAPEPMQPLPGRQAPPPPNQ